MLVGGDGENLAEERAEAPPVAMIGPSALVTEHPFRWRWRRRRV